MTTISAKITRYRDYQDDEEMFLYYFYVGMNCAIKFGYDENLVNELEKHTGKTITAFLKGYMEGS